jgi:hypothetical protein
MVKQPKKTGLTGLLETRQTCHSTQSIERWKQAINAFESPANPTRTLLYDLYDDILLDSQVEATWGKRQDAVLNRRLAFVRDGAEDEEVTRLLNAPDMRGIIRELHNAIAWGYTLVQINRVWFDEEQENYRIDFDLIPRKHVHPEPGFECVSREQSSCSADFLYMKPPLSNYMVWAGEPKDRGLLVKVAPGVIYKRGGFGDWAQFSEMFGMPFRDVTYDGYDEDSRRKMDGFMQQWSARSYLLHPSDVKLEMHYPSGSMSTDTYDRFIAVCDACISKTILGNTLTTEQGEKGTQALGRVHESEEDAKKASDELFLLSILNTRLRAVLKRFGINIGGGEIWFSSPEKDWNRLQAKWNVVSAVSDKVPVADDYIYGEFDIPKPDNYDEMKEEMRLEKQAGLASIFGAGPQPTGPPKEKPERKQLFARLKDFFV